MAIQLRAKSAVATGSTGLTLDKPTGTVDGDIMIMAVVVHDLTSTGSPPGDWTKYAATSSTNGTAWFAWKRASGEGSSYSVTSLADSCSGIIATFYNCVASGDPIDQSAGKVWNTFVMPGNGTEGITTGTANCMIVSAMCWMDNHVGNFSSWIATNPSSFTEADEGGTNTGSDTMIGLAYALQSGSGATGETTCSVANWDENVGLVCAIKPLVEVPPPDNMLMMMGIGI